MALKLYPEPQPKPEPEQDDTPYHTYLPARQRVSKYLNQAMGDMVCTATGTNDNGTSVMTLVCLVCRKTNVMPFSQALTRMRARTPGCPACHGAKRGRSKKELAYLLTTEGKLEKHGEVNRKLEGTWFTGLDFPLLPVKDG